MTKYYISKKKKLHKSVHKDGCFIFYSWNGTKWHFMGNGNGNWLNNQCCSLDHLKRISKTEAFIELL